jgi:hypothetical protein
MGAVPGSGDGSAARVAGSATTGPAGEAGEVDGGTTPAAAVVGAPGAAGLVDDKPSSTSVKRA